MRIIDLAIILLWEHNLDATFTIQDKLSVSFGNAVFCEISFGLGSVFLFTLLSTDMYSSSSGSFLLLLRVFVVSVVEIDVCFLTAHHAVSPGIGTQYLKN